MRALIASLILVLAVGVGGCAPSDSDEAADDSTPATESSGDAGGSGDTEGSSE